MKIITAIFTRDQIIGNDYLYNPRNHTVYALIPWKQWNMTLWAVKIDYYKSCYKSLTLSGYCALYIANLHHSFTESTCRLLAILISISTISVAITKRCGKSYKKCVIKYAFWCNNV